MATSIRSGDCLPMVTPVATAIPDLAAARDAPRYLLPVYAQAAIEPVAAGGDMLRTRDGRGLWRHAAHARRPRAAGLLRRPCCLLARLRASAAGGGARPPGGGAVIPEQRRAARGARPRRPPAGGVRPRRTEPRLPGQQWRR